MGTARRKTIAEEGTAAGIYDDLRIIRSRGGFSRSRETDLAASVAAHRGELSCEEVREDLQDFTSDFIDKVLDDDDARAVGQRMAAGSLRRLMLDEGVTPPDFLAVRDDAAGHGVRDHEYVRKQEDLLLGLLAQVYSRKLSKRIGPSDRPATSTETDPALTGEPEATDFFGYHDPQHKAVSTSLRRLYNSQIGRAHV